MISGEGRDGEEGELRRHRRTRTDNAMADYALRLRRAIDVALNCLAIDVGADRIPPQDEGGGGRGDGNENDRIDDDDDDDDDVVVPTMDETVVATGGKGRRKGGRGGGGQRTTRTRVSRRRDVPGCDEDGPPLRVLRDEDPRGWGDEHRPEGVGEGRRWRPGGVATRVGCQTRTGRAAADVRGSRGGRARTIESRTTAVGGRRREEGGERSASTTIRRAAGRGVAGGGDDDRVCAVDAGCRTQPRRRRGPRGG